jgi:DNA replication protein DnaC
MRMSEATGSNTATHTTDTPQLLLEYHLKELRLPTILREYDKVARQCAAEQVDYARYLLRMTELELLDRERRATDRRIRQAKFPVVKTMDSFDFLAIPTLNKTLVLELARCEFLGRRENVLLLGNSGTGKTHIALALGLAACQRGHRVRFTTASALVSELIEARDEKKLLRFQKQIASYELLIVDELGFVPLSKTGAELLFEVLNDTADLDRYFDCTEAAEFLYGCVAHAIDEDLPHEIDFLRRNDEAKRRIMNLVEMPDRMTENLVRLIRVNEGKLGRKRREGEFEKLTDDEVVSIEVIVREAFEDFEG